MAEILATIAEHVRGVVERRRRELPIEALRDRPLVPCRRPRGFARSLTRKPAAHHRRGQEGLAVQGTDSRRFRPGGDRPGLRGARRQRDFGVDRRAVFSRQSGCIWNEIHARVQVPLLRKDFMLDPYQLIEAKSYGADAVLFIAAMLDRHLMRDLRAAGERPADWIRLVEVHREKRIGAALEAGAQLIGINNRDLEDFRRDLATTEKLAPLVPPGMPAVCESGIDSIEQIRRIEKCGIHVFLIGESLMRAPAPGKKLEGTFNVTRVS